MRYYISMIVMFTISMNMSARFNPDAYIFSYLTADDGLAQNTIDYIYKDSRGFMWFATWNGLNRYDGYKFIRYHTRSEKYPVNSLFVRTLVEDDYQQMWVGTEAGINVIDIYSGEVISFASSQFSEDRIFSASINTLLKDKKGRIWVGHNDGIAIVSFNEKGEIAAIDALQENVKVNKLYEDESGRIWIGYNNGVRLANGLSDKVIHFETLPGALGNELLGEVFAFCQDGTNIWIGTADGLLCYDLQSEKHVIYTTNASDPYSIVQNYIKDIIKDHEDNLYVATFKGISVYNRASDDFTSIMNSSVTTDKLNNNFVNCLYYDAENVLWIGTEKGGINKMVKKEIKFGAYQHNNKLSTSLAPYPVNAIFEDTNRQLWIGTVEGGLNKRIDDSDRFIHYQNNPAIPFSLPRDAVSVITEENGNLWIGSWGDGVCRMELSKEGYFVRLKDIVEEGICDCPFVSDIIFDAKLNVLWIAARSGVYVYELAERRFSSILYRNKPIETSSSLLLDHSGRLWIGSENGLYCMYIDKSDIHQKQFEIESCRLTLSEKSKQQEKINCLFEAKDQTIWIGSNGNALYKLTGREEDQYVFKNYGTEVGFSDNVIYAIEEDQQGYLWLSTNMGLSYFCPEKERAITFYASDGLLSNQFYWAASCHTSDGKMLFGNLNGAVIFDPSEINEDTTELTVSIVDGKLYNESVNFRQIMDGWNLKEAQKSFSIEFSSLYYTSPEKIKYRYMLEGFDTDWTEVDANRHFANYTNLPSGDYIFKVKSTNPNGEWSDNVTQLDIRIIPPFYKRKWFIASSLLLVVLLFVYFNEIRIRRLRRQKEQLEGMVDERTRKIALQKDELAVQAQDLEEANTKLNKATQDKIAFFTNISHEFKTPLTLILGPVEQAMKISKNEKVQEYLGLIQKNSTYLLSLLNQLMDFRKVDSGNMKINKSEGNFREFVHNVVEPFYLLINGRNIRIEEQYYLQQEVFFFDRDLMQKVLVNLLSNAVKFTPDNGLIRVYIALLPQNETYSLYISIHDSGPGIPEDLEDDIFKRFYQIDNQAAYPVYGQSGTGIGLFLCKQIVMFLGGGIQVSRSFLGGAAFRILLPLDEADLETLHVETYEDADVKEDAIADFPDDKKPLLLIVEDHADMRVFIRSVLEKDFNIIEASNGKQALDKTLKYLPDFIIADIMMPVMDGLEYCKKVKNNFMTSHIPVLLLTAKSSTEVRIEGYNAGADGYIAKPFDAGLLVARINNILGSQTRMHKAFESSMDVKSLNMKEESQDRKFVDRIMKIIEENYQDTTFDVSELVEKMHMSKSLLHKKLHSLIGQPAVKMIRSYRLTKAKELILLSKGEQMNISEVAYKVGFNDPKYFTRCFTKHFGMTPSKCAEEVL